MAHDHDVAEEGLTKNSTVYLTKRDSRKHRVDVAYRLKTVSSTVNAFARPSWNYTRIGLLRNNVLERTPAPGRDMFSSRILLSIPSRRID